MFVVHQVRSQQAVLSPIEFFFFGEKRLNESKKLFNID